MDRGPAAKTCRRLSRAAIVLVRFPASCIPLDLQRQEPFPAGHPELASGTENMPKKRNSVAHPRPAHRKNSLRRVFLTLVAATYLATAAGAFFAFSWSARAISGEFLTRFVEAQSMLEQNRILSLVDRELVLSQKLADDPQIRAWMADEENPVAREQAGQQVESYRRFLGYGTAFLAFSSSNHFYVTIPESQGFERTTLVPGNSSDQWFYDFLERADDYALNVNYDALLDEVRVWINVLVKDSAGRPIGVAGSGMDLTEFLDHLVDHRTAGTSSMIINSAGELQAHEDRALIEHNGRATTREEDKITVFDLLADDESRERLQGAIAAGGEAPRIFPLKTGGKSALAALASIPDLDWHNLVVVDADSVMGLSDFLPLGLVFLVSLLVVLAGLFIVLNRLILTPLGALTRAAGAVAEGAYETALPPAGTAEIGQLSTSFKTMTERIREHTEDLESKVAERTRSLAETNRELVESQERILDSIQYARLIQHSMLPSSAELAKHFDGHFVLFEPLEVVGGDFYFIREVDDGFCVAAVDCTGHGVPAALMTMMANALLNRVIELYPNETPGRMLNHLHELVRATWKSEDNEALAVENGLDIALCRVLPKQDVLEFAGAGLPLFVREGNKIRVIPGDRRHLGFTSSKIDTPFTDHRIKIQGDSAFYLITDGILDLPGGKDGFGLGTIRLRKILENQNAVALREQEKPIRSSLDDYQGSRDRRDDILLLGFHVRPTKKT